VTLKTAPLEQWGVAREMRERIKARFDHLGIELARPARVLIHRDNRGPDEDPETTGASDSSETPASS
jgi:small conductance mechanosensitive channel